MRAATSPSPPISAACWPRCSPAIYAPPIASSPEPADFANTIEALERSGALLRRVGRVFNNLTSSATNSALDGIDRDYAPKLAAHRIKIMLDSALFARIDALWRARDKLEL